MQVAIWGKGGWRPLTLKVFLTDSGKQDGVILCVPFFAFSLRQMKHNPDYRA